jgi:hypothetical protein
MTRLLKRLRVLLLGCPVCRHRWTHLTFCVYGRGYSRRWPE